MNHSSIKALLVGDVIELIAKKYKISLKEATKMYYCSNVARMMSNDETMLYGESAFYIFSIFEQYH